jgi:hypothetical protein
MVSKLALYVPLQAKPGKEEEIADFLRSALPFVNDEPGTVSWFATWGYFVCPVALQGL